MPDPLDGLFFCFVTPDVFMGFREIYFVVSVDKRCLSIKREVLREPEIIVMSLIRMEYLACDYAI